MADTERCFLKVRTTGLYIGVAPSEPNTVYADRPAANGWEATTVTKLDNGLYSVRFEMANKLLSLQPDGTFQTRDNLGEWEQLAGGRIESGPQAGLRILGPFVVESV